MQVLANESRLHPPLKKFFRVLATNRDREGVEFVSLMEVGGTLHSPACNSR